MSKPAGLVARPSAASTTIAVRSPSRRGKYRLCRVGKGATRRAHHSRAPHGGHASAATCRAIEDVVALPTLRILPKASMNKLTVIISGGFSLAYQKVLPE